MEPISTIRGSAYPLGLKNVDTDVIIGAEWLKTISRSGLGEGVFAVLRRASNVFDDPRYVGSPLLIAGENFGCGSSREHAAWALADIGIKAVLAPSFSDIFASNAFKNGILTVVLPQGAIDRLLADTGMQIAVDLGSQTVTTSSGDLFTFEIDPFRKSCLIEGKDEIDLTIVHRDAIAAFEARSASDQPWVARGTGQPTP